MVFCGVLIMFKCIFPNDLSNLSADNVLPLSITVRVGNTIEITAQEILKTKEYRKQ